MTVGISIQGPVRPDLGVASARINDAFQGLNATQILPNALNESSRPFDWMANDPIAWIDVLGHYTAVTANLPRDGMWVLVTQFLWLRNRLWKIHLALISNMMEESVFSTDMGQIEGHISQWDNFCRTGQHVEPSMPPRYLPVLWGLENEGTLHWRDATWWLEAGQIMWTAEVFEACDCRTTRLILVQGLDTLVMSYWGVLAVYRYMNFAMEPHPAPNIICKVQMLCARFAFMIAMYGADELVPDLAHPQEEFDMEVDWKAFPDFSNGYIGRLRNPDENDEFETISGFGVLVVARAGLVRPYDWLRLSLCLGLNPGCVVLPLPAVRLLQAFKGLFCFHHAIAPANSLLAGPLGYLVMRLEFLAHVPMQKVASPGGKLHYVYRPNWPTDDVRFCMPLKYENGFFVGDINSMKRDPQRAAIDAQMQKRVLTISPILALYHSAIESFVGANIWMGLPMPLAIYFEFANAFELMKLLYQQTRRRSFTWSGVPATELRLLAEKIGVSSSDQSAIERILSEGVSMGNAKENFAAIAAIFVALCGPLCLYDSDRGLLCLADGRSFDLSAVSALMRDSSSGLFFDAKRVQPWKCLWDIYKKAGLVFGDFPKTDKKYYANEGILKGSAEMEALRRCISTLIYQFSVPLVFLTPRGRARVGFVVVDGLRHIFPGAYFPPNAEMLARAICTKIPEMGEAPHRTIEELQAFLTMCLLDFPEVDTPAIRMLAEAFLQEEEWTQRPDLMIAFLTGYFDGRFSHEA
ncbi:MAG: hypothetical protein LBB26_02230 [Puniceicoccales bacterium]|jgi:hypothetical protein|nr:hypothetical protein [Puniceicoccales bacterium]